MDACKKTKHQQQQHIISHIKVIKKCYLKLDGSIYFHQLKSFQLCIVDGFKCAAKVDPASLPLV